MCSLTKIIIFGQTTQLDAPSLYVLLIKVIQLPGLLLLSHGR